MAVQYNKLWKLLIDRKMSKGELGKLAGISPNTMTKLRRDEIVALPILDKICDCYLESRLQSSERHCLDDSPC